MREPASTTNLVLFAAVPLGEYLLKSFRSDVIQLGEDLFPAVFFKEAA